jgi:putative glutamine amidotransferase
MFHRPILGSPAAPQRAALRPVIGLLCCNERLDRPVQTVANRFVQPLAAHAGAAALLVPALPDALDAATLVAVLDGLMLTGSRSNVAPARYGAEEAGGDPRDEDRDEVALRLAAAMIEAGKPVFGICRGLQELNVLFGGTLTASAEASHHHPAGEEASFEALFGHRHGVDLIPGGLLAAAAGSGASVNSVHRQGIDRLGAGLRVEARAPDGLVEAFSSRPFGADVLAVQWHPEWETESCDASLAFFARVGEALALSKAKR